MADLKIVSTVAELREALAAFPDDMLVTTGDAWEDGRVEIKKRRHGPSYDTRNPFYVADADGFGWMRVCALVEAEEENVEEDGDNV